MVDRYKIDQLGELTDLLGDAVFRQDMPSIITNCEDVKILFESIAADNAAIPRDEYSMDELMGIYEQNLESLSISDLIETLDMMRDRAIAQIEYEAGDEYRAEMDAEYAIDRSREQRAGA